MSDDIDAHLKIAVALRSVRGALGLNQAEFAELVGVSKPTIARAETMEVAMRLDSYSNVLRKLREIGVKVDTLYSDSVQIEFEPQALESLRERLADQGRRRQDRTQTGIGVLKPVRLTKDDHDRIAKRTQETLSKLPKDKNDQT
ncbi:helix-turn-helix domain-containing protein [Billgrantia sp. LNSP4103-1]|uniref:helix-turn-helix domain-containing protein n=1 Tax=Billgrantia sp. LNSP4103-1 TaxID=3410266 RepID=UPI00403F40BD